MRLALAANHADFPLPRHVRLVGKMRAIEERFATIPATPAKERKPA